MRMALLGSRDQLALQIIQGGEQRNRSVAIVVMGLRSNVADPERHSGLGPLQGLTLALLIAAQHQCLIGRIEVQADHVPELLLEFRIAGDLECAHQVRLQIIAPPNLMHAMVRDSDFSRHPARAPSRASLRWLCHPRNYLPHLLGWKPGLPAPAILVI